MVADIRAPATERVGNRPSQNLNHRVTSRLYPLCRNTQFSAKQPGDSNGDGTVDQLDISLVLQSGKYLSGDPATFTEGDWNEDGLFDQRDIVFALQAGTFIPRSRAAKQTQLLDAVFAGAPILMNFQ